MNTPTPTPRPALKATGMRRRYAPTPMPRTCGEISCDECNDRYAALAAECDQLRAEVERLRSDRDCEKRLRKDADEFRENAIERAARAEDNLAALEQCHDDNCRQVVRIADELATAKERLRTEAMDDYAAIKDLQRELAAERRKAERFRLVTLRQDCELAAERARLDWVFHNCKVTSDDFTVHDREDLGVAMKEGAK